MAGMRQILILALSLLVLAVVGCTGEEPIPNPGQDRSAASKEATDSANRAKEDAARPPTTPKGQPEPKPSSGGNPAAAEAIKDLKQVPPPPWVVNPPPKGQKPIYGLPLDIHIDVPPVPEKIAQPAPPLAK